MALKKRENWHCRIYWLGQKNVWKIFHSTIANADDVALIPVVILFWYFSKQNFKYSFKKFIFIILVLNIYSFPLSFFPLKFRLIINNIKISSQK